MTKQIDLARTKILLIGEIHGIRENVEVLKIFVKKYFATNRRFIVAFEWPSSLSSEVNQYLSGETKKLFWEKWDFINDKDGRISKEHIKFLSWLKKKNLALSPNRRISVLCFDEMPKRWNARDKMMAENLKKAKFPVIAIMGSLHAQKTKFKLGKEEYEPVGFCLSDKKIITIKIDYSSGKFYNHGIKKIQTKKRIRAGILKTEGGDFDYIYTIKTAHPVELLELQ